MVKDGWTVAEKEQRVIIDVATGKYRYPDITAVKDGITKYVQVGKQTLAGNPIAREMRALTELNGRFPGSTIFVPYNN